MSTRKKRSLAKHVGSSTNSTPSSINNNNSSSSTPAAKKQCIDMSHIPESLKKEGYLTSEADDAPDYLLCPICKELFVEPLMFNCGHTVCSLCLEGNQTRSCPVCKAPGYSQIPNYVLKQVIEQQYPELHKSRSQEYASLKELRSKLALYPGSRRNLKLVDALREFCSSQFFVHHKQLIDHLKKVDLTPAVSESEACYFLATRTTSGYPPGLFDVGQYFICNRSYEPYLMWLENKDNKKKENIKWSPLVMFAMTSGAGYDSIKRFASLLKLDIGDKLSLEEWKHRSPTWLRDVPVESDASRLCPDCGVVHALHPSSRIFHGAHGLGPYFEYDTDEDSDDYSEDSDDYF